MPKNNESHQSIVAVDVYLERRKSRDYVGRLSKIKHEGKSHFEFEYDGSYLLKPNAIPLGPEFPLTQERFVNRKLFQTFDDRIPSRKNPAYPEYCKAFGIDPEEGDVQVLLSTIGRKGPSSFVFEGVKPADPGASNVAEFRKRLGLSIREFAAVFDTSTATVQKLEQGKSNARELIKRLQIYMEFPEVALWEVRKNRAKIHDDTYQQLISRLGAEEPRNSDNRKLSRDSIV